MPPKTVDGMSNSEVPEDQPDRIRTVLKFYFSDILVIIVQFDFLSAWLGNSAHW